MMVKEDLKLKNLPRMTNKIYQAYKNKYDIIGFDVEVASSQLADFRFEHLSVIKVPIFYLASLMWGYTYF